MEDREPVRAAPMTQTQRPAKVLLVEDSEDDAFFFRRTLRKSGTPCEVIHVTDGAAAIAQLAIMNSGAEPPPDVVFLDLKLPVLTGFDVLRWIRDHGFRPPLHVVVLSGSEQASDKTQARALGASGYLVKPITAEQLRELLRIGAPSLPATLPGSIPAI